MTFQQLTYVVEISKCGSINKAAGRLNLSQSGISAAVRELEEELGIQFFRRSNRGVEFTPEGEEFLGYAVSLLEQKRRVEGLYGPGRDQGSPARFSVSTQRYPFTGEAFLQLLRAAEDRRFRFSLKETGMDAVIDDVYDHRSDLGVIYLTEMTEKIVGRLLDARALTFLQRFDALTTVVDAKDYNLASAASSDVATYFNPLLHTAVFRVFAEELSFIRQHPLSKRRYMWKIEY